MATDAEYAAFFLDSHADVFQQALIEVSHPNFSKVHRIVATDPGGLTVTLSPEEGDATFDYYPLKVRRSAEQGDLDQGVRVDLGDIGTVWPQELDRVKAADGSSTKPVFRYWTYRSDDLTKPLFGPLRLEVTDFSYTEDGVSFEAMAPRLNNLGTGETYLILRFPMLRGTL